MKNLIWYEMVQYKFGSIYMGYYVTRLNNQRKYYKIVSLILSTSGIFAWKIWESFPIVVCVVLSLMQILDLIKDVIVPSEEFIESVSELCLIYTNHFDTLEDIWIKRRAKTFTDEQCNVELGKLKATSLKLNTLRIKTDIKDVESIILKTNTETNNYFKERHSQ